MTSVGSGSLIIVALMLMYPTLSSKETVGTDLVQAIPLVAADGYIRPVLVGVLLISSLGLLGVTNGWLLTERGSCRATRRRRSRAA